MPEDDVTAPNVPVWEDGAWEALPRLEGDVEADVCVVGLGGSGLTCIGALLGLGRTVIGIDAGAVGGGAAGRNGGFLLAGTSRFYHDAVAALGRERARALYAMTAAEIGRIAAETPEAVRRVGSLRIAASAEEEADCRAHREALRADGFPAEAYEGPEGRGMLIPTDAAFHPLRRCRALARAALAGGARLFEHAPAVEIGAGFVRTPAGRVRCGRTVVAVDGGLDRLVPALAGRVRTARLQMVATAPLSEIRFPRPVYMRWGYEWWQQLPDGRIALGGFRDRAGEGEWTHDAGPSEPVQGMIERFLRESLGVDVPITHRWAASVGYTADGMPVLEEVQPGVWATGGYSGTGNVVGALLGRAAAELAVEGHSEIAAPFLGG
ncbi:MAG TPA: FAD-binding oxidoreductase [Longimicrobium sp.]|nr:FAD-binding oxidoreductase [Longimicrobium sp.]